MASPESQAPNALQLVKLYARRMQIELAFRGLKSNRYGQALEDSLTRQGARLQVLLLVRNLASFVIWLAGLDRYLTFALAQQERAQALFDNARWPRALVRRWPLEPISRWLERLKSLPQAVVDQMQLTA